MPFRVLRYMVRIWDGWLAEHDEAYLPVIVPIVLHHSDSGWTGAVALEEILDVSRDMLVGLGPHVPRLTFLLDDLTNQTDEALRARTMTALGQSVLWCLRDGRKHGEIARRLERWADAVIEVLRSPSGLAAFSALMRYILSVTELTVEDLQRSVLATLGEEVKDAMKTTGERLREEGRLVGRLEGQREILLRQLRLRFGDLPTALEARVQSASGDELEAWSEHFVTAKTLAEVFGNA